MGEKSPGSAHFSLDHLSLQEHLKLLIRRSSTVLRFFVPLGATALILSAAGVVRLSGVTQSTQVGIAIVATALLSVLLVIVERERRSPESREPSLLAKQVPWFLSLLFLGILSLFSIATLPAAGWGAIFAFAIFVVAGLLPMPLSRVSPLFLAYYALLLWKLTATALPSDYLVPIAISSGAATLLALFVNYEIYRRSLEAIAWNLDLQRTNYRLQGTVERNRKLLSIVSHDVRAPLGSIVQLFDFVEERRDRFSPEELAEIMSDVTSSLRTSYHLLDNLLSWARSVSGSVQVSRQQHPVEELLQSSLGPAVLSARRKGINLQREVDIGLEVVVDRQMIEVSLRNVISNAVKFTPAEGTVTVRASNAFDEGVVVEVIDTGIGMSSEEVTRLLRDDQNPTSRVGTAGEHGSGLGFELTRHFVELNSGKITVDSSPGSGTRVTLHLPGGYNPDLAREVEPLPEE